MKTFEIRRVRPHEPRKKADAVFNKYQNWNCKTVHYLVKNNTEHANLYAEFPVYAVGHDFKIKEGVKHGLRKRNKRLS